MNQPANKITLQFRGANRKRKFKARVLEAPAPRIHLLIQMAIDSAREAAEEAAAKKSNL